MPIYCNEHPAKQWEHWIRRFKSKKALDYVLPVIPVGNPTKLSSDIYFMVIKQFLLNKDFGNLIISVEKFKPHLLNYDNVYDLLNEVFKENNEVINNSLFFKTFQKISEYTNNKMGLFLMFLNLQNYKTFDIIYDDGVVCEIGHAPQLLNISPIKTVDFYINQNK